MFYQAQTARMQAAERAKNAVFVPGDLDLWTFKLVRARDQTPLSCKFGANPFSSSWGISYTNKKSHRQRQNRTFRSSLRAV